MSELEELREENRLLRRLVSAQTEARLAPPVVVTDPEHPNRVTIYSL